MNQIRPMKLELKSPVRAAWHALGGLVCMGAALLMAGAASAQGSGGCSLLMNCPSNIVVTSCFNVQEFYFPTASNICCGVNSTVTCSPPSGSIFAVGTTTTVTCTATDCAQNTNFCTFTVTVLPGLGCATNYLQVQCPSNIVVTSCTNIQEFYAPIVTDTACSNWTVVLSPPAGSFFAPNTTTLVDCFVGDYCGETNDCSFTVTVMAGTNCPTDCLQVECPTNKKVKCGSKWAFDLPQVISCCPTNFTTSTGPPTNILIIPISTITNGGCPQPQYITQTWQITDACGDTTNCSQTVEVAGCCTNCLSLTCPADILTSSCSNCAMVNFSATATDLCCSNVQVSYWLGTALIGTNYCFPVGLSTVTVLASDDCSNNASCSFTVTVLPCGQTNCIDLVCPADIATTVCGTNCAMVDFAASALDYCCSNVTVSYRLNGAVIGTNYCFPVGQSTVSVEAGDACGNTAGCNFTVTVTALTNPPAILSAPTNVTICEGTGVSGTVIVDNDEWDNSDPGFGFEGLANGDAYVTNCANYLTGNGAHGRKILICSDDFSLNESDMHAALIGAGYTVTYSVPPLPSLSGYNAVYVGGDSLSATELTQLQNFVCAGGGLYIAAGTGAISGGAAGEAAQWNVLLNGFGLNLASFYNLVSGNLAIPSPLAVTASPVMANITAIYNDNGNNVNTLVGYPQAQIIASYGAQGMIGVSSCSGSGTNGCGLMPNLTGLVTVSGGTFTQSIPSGTVICADTNVTLTVSNACGSTNLIIPVILVNCASNCLSLTCPTNILTSSCSNCAMVNFSATATDLCCSNVQVSYWLGTTLIGTNYCFPLGQNTVTVLASDACSNDASCSFTVTVAQGGCVPPPTNMVLWLPFDETSGPLSANVAPVVGASNGLQEGGPTVDFGAYVDNSLSFNGVDQYVTVADYSAIEIGTENLTIDAWVNRATNSGTSVQTLVDKRIENTGGYYGYSLAVSYNNLILQLADGSYNNFRDTGTVPADGHWHFVAVTVSRTSPTGGQFYVDGVPTATFNPTGYAGSLANTAALEVGNSALNPSYWLGGIDEVELFNRALGSNEIAAIYGAGPCGKCKPPCTNLVVICPSPKTVQCGTAWTFDLPLATSCCGSKVTVAVTATVTNGICPKEVTRNWLLTDACGNSATCSQTVTVVDTTPPVITCETNTVIVVLNTNCQLVIPSIQASATDNCTSASQLVYTQSPTNGTVVNGTSAYVTVTVTDLCGNSNECRVLVSGRYPPPVINCPGVVTASNCVVPNVLPLVTATGCNGGKPFVFSQTPLPGTALGPGSDTITVTVTGLGGSDSCVIAVQYGGQQSFLNVLTNTGVSVSGALLAENAVDPHYTLGPVPAATPGYTAPQALAVTNLWSWLEVTPHASEWIAPATYLPPNWYLANNPGGYYTYTNQFTLPVGANPATASIGGRWAADDGAVAMLINNHPTGNSIATGSYPNYGFSHWTPFTINSGFVSGLNTILFVVTNADNPSPTGLRVEYTNAVFNCSTCAPPSIVWMTPSQSVPQFGTATFTVNVAGTGPFTYQWYHNNAPVGGANGPSLTLRPLTFANAGTYYVHVCNACGCINSSTNKLTVTTGFAWSWGWWNFSVATDYLAAAYGPDLILSGTNTLAIASGSTLDFGLPNPAEGVASVLDVSPLTPGTQFQVPLIAPTGSSVDHSYTLIMDLYEPDTSLGTPSTLCQSIPCCVSNLSSGGQDGVTLTLDSSNLLHITGSAAGSPFDTGPTLAFPVDAWNRVAFVVDDPQDGLAVTLSVYLNGGPAATLAVPTPVGLPVNWSNGAPILLSRQTSDVTVNGEFYASSIQFHAVALTSQAIAGMGSPAAGPMPGNDTSVGTEPALSATLSSGSVSFTWSGNSYVLQESSSLTADDWSDSALAFTEASVNGTIQTTATVTPAASGPTKFYRLIFRP